MRAITAQQWMQRALARPKTDFPPPDALMAVLDDDGKFAVRVTPGAREEAISVSGGKLQVKVRARPADGEANAAVLKLLAKSLGVSTSRLRMLRGATGREKQFQLSD